MRTHSRARCSESQLKDILAHAPTSKEMVLREMGFERMVYKGITQIFRVSNEYVTMMYYCCNCFFVKACI